MNVNDLSQEDRALLNTDFGGLEKEAAEQVKVASAMGELGEAYAQEIADNFDKVAAEEKDMEDKLEKMDEESEKKAMDLSAFIEKGFVEKMASLGTEVAGDSLAFLRPYVVNELVSTDAPVDVIKVAMEMMDGPDEEESKKEQKDEDAKKEASVSAQDEELLNTDFGDLEKEAAEQIKLASDMYSLGEDYAIATAEAMLKQAADADMDGEEDEDEDEDSKKEASVGMDSESEKTASDLSAFIERGFTEKLASLGEERYGNPLHYFEPYIIEKVAKDSSEKSNHVVRRIMLGNPLSAAISAEKGKKGKAYREAWGHAAKGTLKGMATGAGAGAGLSLGAAGAAAGAGAVKALAHNHGGAKAKILAGLTAAGKGIKRSRRSIAHSTTVGTGVGAGVGSLRGGFKGTFGDKATEIHNKYSK